MQNGQINQGGVAQQPVQKRAVSSGGSLMWRLLTFSFVVFFIMIASYVGLDFGYRVVLENQNQDYIDQSVQLQSSIPEEQREKVVDFYSRLSNMKNLLNSHVYATNFFEFLEDNTDSGVYFTEVNLVVRGGEISVTGFARDYQELSRQLEKLRLSDEVSGLVLDSAVRSQNGLVSFEASFMVAPSLFRS